MPPAPPTPTGAHLIAQTLHRIGVTVLFGIVGIPVVEIAEEAINLGIRFIGFRNEQAASYAAGAYGYLTGRPGVCLVVGGPGVLHAVAGVRSNIFLSPFETLVYVCICRRLELLKLVVIIWTDDDFLSVGIFVNDVVASLLKLELKA